MSPLTWWKGVRLHTKANTGYWKAVSETKESQTPIIAMIPLTDLFTHDLVLWKAKVRFHLFMFYHGPLSFQ